ncbi:MAG: hypothetical protein PWP06_1747 [Candidatus Marinimicrobia bacterium]|nr:hypothetical protein [Candidatus Neomarinimicrobiota bacterium]
MHPNGKGEGNHPDTHTQTKSVQCFKGVPNRDIPNPKLRKGFFMHIPHGFKTVLTAIILILSAFQWVFAQSPGILIDGQFDDWSNLEELWTSFATESDGNVTLQTLKASNDENFLFIYFKTAETFSLQEDYALTLYVDTDNNSSTGLYVDGMGADIEFTFNQRSGVMHLSTNTSISFSDLFMVTAPTVWSEEYEISISRHTENPSGQPVFTAPSVCILMKDESVTSPNASKTAAVTYTISPDSPEYLPSYTIQKKSGDYLRVLSHNVQFDGFFESENLSAFERLYAVINPDMIGFSEIYNHSDEDVSARLEAILPSPQGKSWNVAHVYDNFLATRYTILEHYACGGYGNGAFYLDLRPDYPANALVIVGHPPCCAGNDEARSDEIDAIAAFIRDAKSGDGDLTLPEYTPIIILGDMNLVGNPHQWTTLLSGDIDNEMRFGPDFRPDWDNSDFEDALPLVSGLPMTFTQGVGTYPGSYAKGRLDVILYSASVLELKNSFVLYTNALPEDSLMMYQLQSDDSESASDHFPLVSDFKVCAKNENPSIPQPLDPDSVIVLTLKPVFIWTPSTDPDPGDKIKYELYVQSKTSSVTIPCDSNWCILSEALSDNEEYTWYVKALDLTSGYSVSPVATFWTDLFPEPPGPFNTIRPEDGEKVDESLVTFIWQSALDPDPQDDVVYTLKYKSIHPDSLTWHETEAGTDTSLTLNLSMGQRYTWQVIATDDDGYEVAGNQDMLSSFDVGNVTALESQMLPRDFYLGQNFPNPFNPVTTISYGLPEPSDVTINIYDISGRRVRQWLISDQRAGWHVMTWDGTNRQGQPLSTGIYLYSLKAGGFKDIKKMVYMK